MAGYKLTDPPLAGDLTKNQQIFVALSENKFLETMLAPYIDKKPSEDAMEAEHYRISRLAKKYKAKDMAGVDMFKWNGIGSPYDKSEPNSGD